MTDWTKIVNFSPSEFSQPEMMEPELIGMLDKARAIYGKPITIISSYRDPFHPVEVSKPEGSYATHTHGEAVDIAAISGKETMALVKALCDAGFERMGISRKNKFIHVDIGNITRRLPVSLWTY